MAKPPHRGAMALRWSGAVGPQLDNKLVLNVIALAVFAALFGLTMRRGVTDPVCGMRVVRAKAL